jgi:hypothetical protein
MTLDTVLSWIRSSGFRYTKITDPKGRKIAIYTSGTGEIEPTADQVCAWLTDFFERYPGVYNIVCKKRKSVSHSEAFIYENVTAARAMNGMQTIPIPVEPVDEIAVEKRITERLMAQFKQAEKDKAAAAMLAEAKRKSEELDSAAGKLMHIGTRLFEMLLSKNPQLLGMLQGPPPQQNNTMPETNNTEPIEDLSNLTPEMQQKCNTALTLLLRHMHPDLLMKFAVKINSEPGLVKTLSSLI